MASTFDPKAPPLTEEQTKDAVAELVRSYPKVVRNKCDPEIARQNIANVSFKILKEPQNGVYGLCCIRGVFEDLERATDAAEFLIKTSDSTVPIHQAHVGYWCLITNNEEFSKDKLDAKTQEQEQTLRGRAEKEAERKRDQIKQELIQQKEKLEQERKIEDFDSLDYYTTQRVSEREIRGLVAQHEAKLETQRKSLKKVQTLLEKLRQKNPEHEEHWLENYNNARVRAGLTKLTEEDIMKIPALG